MSTPPVPSRVVWWLSPFWVVVVGIIPVGLAIHALPANWFVTQVRCEKVLDAATLALFLASTALFALGALVGDAMGGSKFGRIHAQRWPDPVARSFLVSDLMTMTLATLFVLTLAAYAVWFRAFISNPALLLVLTTTDVEQGYGRELSPTIGGLTTLTQLGIVFVIVGCLRLRLAASGALVRLAIALLLVLGGLRAFIHSERLAFLELVIPITIVLIASSQRRNIAIQAIPFIAVAVVIVLFGLSEFFRSWLHFYAQRESSFVFFVVNRFFGYYATSLNNAAGLLQHSPEAFGPALTAQWIYRIPLLSESTLQRHGLEIAGHLKSYTYTYANPEFNTFAGLFGPLLDFGIVGGLGVLVVIGMACGYLHRRFVAGSLLGILMYPHLFLGLLELLRLFSWGSGKYFPVWTMTLLLVVMGLALNARNLRRADVNTLK